MPRTYFPTPSSPKHNKYWEDQMNLASSSSKSHTSSSSNNTDTWKELPSTVNKERKFDRWERYDTKVNSPTSVADEITTNDIPNSARYVTMKPNRPSEVREPGASKTKRTPYKRIIPGVSDMNMRQILAVVFSAYWDRADLYMDVLGLDHDQPTDKELRLAFFKQGREVLATPIESPDDATMLTYGRAPFVNDSGGSTISVVQSGVPVSRKAKLKFQAIGLAHDLLSDPVKRSLYEKWRLWNPRVPKPTEQLISRRVAADARIRRQAAMNSSSRFFTHDGQHRFMDSIQEDDQDCVETKTEQHIEDKLSRFPSSRISGKYSTNSAPSILKRSSASKKINQRMSHDRKISWNEEVEELTLMEDFGEGNAADGALNDSFGGAVNTSIEDPYGESPEDWFGSIDAGWFESDSTQQKTHIKVQNPNFRETGFPDRSAHNALQETKINSLGSNIILSGIGNDLDVSCEYDDKPDDSFLVIMGGPPKIKKKHLDKTQIANIEYRENARNKTVSKNGVTAKMHEMPFYTGTPGSKFGPVQNVNDLGSASTQNLPVTNIPIHQNDEDASLLTNDFTSSWYEASNTEDDDVEYDYDDGFEETDCNGMGHTVDLARGFQASLSKYITAAVKDMKEGLAIVGQNWDELDKPNVPRKENKNFFSLEAFEIDAMMGILKSEMTRFNDRFAGCGASEDELEYAESNLKGGPVASSKYKPTTQHDKPTSMFKSSPDSKTKRGFRKRLGSLFSRKTK